MPNQHDRACIPCKLCEQAHHYRHEHWGRYYPDFISPPPKKILEWVNAFKAIYQRVCKVLNLDPKQYNINVEALYEVCIRTEKRYLHYLMYYDGMKMDEIKRLAEIIYWSMRLNLISCKTDDSDDTSVRILAKFFMFTLAGVCNKEGYTFNNLDDKAHDYLIYSLKFRELSRDALVLLAEGLIAKSTASITQHNKAS